MPKYQYKRVLFKEIERGTDYSRMMLPLLKERAATLLQHKWKSKHHGAITLEPIDTVSFIIEPVGNMGTDSIVDAISENRYETLPFELENFTLHLAKAFRLKRITQHQFLTAKLMYEAYSFFEIHETSDIKRFQLSDKTGPYSPFKVKYCTPAMQLRIEENWDKPNLQYYTFKIPPHMMARFFYLGVHLSSMLPYFKESLIAYLNELLKKEESDFSFRYLSNHIQKTKGKIVPYIQNLIRLKILQHESRYKYYIKNDYPGMGMEGSLGMSEPAFRESAEGLNLLVAVLATSPQMPVLCLSESEAQCVFVLPTAEMQAFLHGIFHGRHQTISQPFVGALGAKLLRAMDELPALDDGVPLTPYQTLLKSLYGEEASGLTKSARATEITYPSIDKTVNPHNTHPHAFSLTWHDIFHADRNGANNKAWMRYLRLVFDRRAGLARNPFDGRMPKTVWALTDMDNPGGQICLKAQKELMTASSEASHEAALKKLEQNVAKSFFFFSKEFLGFDVDKMTLSNDLILLDMIRHPKTWRPWLTGMLPEVFLAHYLQGKMVHHAQFLVLKQLTESYPAASDGEIILRRLLLREGEPHDSIDSLFKEIEKHGGVSHFVYWSLNNGLYFDPNVRDLLPPGIKLKLCDNTQKECRYAFEDMIAQLNHKERPVLVPF